NRKRQGSPGCSRSRGGPLPQARKHRPAALLLGPFPLDLDDETSNRQDRVRLQQPKNDATLYDGGLCRALRLWGRLEPAWQGALRMGRVLQRHVLENLPRPLVGSHAVTAGDFVFVGGLLPTDYRTGLADGARAQSALPLVDDALQSQSEYVVH